MKNPTKTQNTDSTSPTSLEAAKERVSAIQAALKKAVLGMVEGDGWQRHLDALASVGPLSLGRLSFNNQVLVMVGAGERPFRNVATFARWHNYKRHPRKGEKALYILQPLPWKKNVENAEGKEEEVRGVFFRALAVFLEAQTEGEELPTSPLAAQRVQGGDAATLATFAALRAHALKTGLASRVEVVEREVGEDSNGFFRPATREIVVKADLSPAHKVKTLVHEMTHARNAKKEFALPLADDEVTAESAAYVVCQALGIDTAGFSFAYVAGWGTGQTKDVELLRRRIERTGEAVSQAAREFLDALADEGDGEESEALAA